MTRNKEEAQRFWQRVNVALAGTDYNLYDLAEAGDVPYKSILSWRQKHLFPDLETASLIARKLSCSLDSLMGIKESREPSVQDRVYEYMEKNFPTVLKDVLNNVEKKTGDSGIKVG